MTKEAKLIELLDKYLEIKRQIKEMLPETIVEVGYDRTNEILKEFNFAEDK